ncbi:MAG TPA: response regulator [Lacunisphaera sp.]|nr:response regulator [Lacunisphaera sp.]
MRQTYYIIVVEKDEVVYEKIVRALNRLGCHHDIRRVSTQEELDEELTRLAPDFVICDQASSEFNSFAVLQQVREFQASMPFALISGGLDEDTQASLVAKGLDVWVDPNRLTDLAPTVEEMLRRRREEQWLCVEEIRRSLPPMPVASRRARHAN